MRKLFEFLLVALVSAMVARGDGDTPIAGLKLASDGNGGGFKFTNLQEVAATTVRVDTVVLGGVAATNWPTDNANLSDVLANGNWATNKNLNLWGDNYPLPHDPTQISQIGLHPKGYPGVGSGGNGGPPAIRFDKAGVIGWLGWYDTEFAFLNEDGSSYRPLKIGLGTTSNHAARMNITNDFATIASQSLIYWVTNTVSFTNTIDFTISGFVANKITLHDVRMFLCLTNGSPTSKRASVAVFRNSNRRCDGMVYLDTNQIYYSMLTTVAGTAGESSNVVSDASGSIVNDLYYKAIDGTDTNDYQRVQSATASAIIWSCTNLFSSGIGTLISHVNQFGGFPYYDATGASSMWFRVTFSGYTGTVRTVINYGL